jgi:hypothetical protein
VFAQKPAKLKAAIGDILENAEANLTSWCGKVGAARSAPKPQALFRIVTWRRVLYSLPPESTAQAIRASLLAMATTNDVLGCPRVECIEPSPDGCSVALDPEHDSSCTMNQDLAEVHVAPLTDAEQLRLTAGGVLTWHDAEPCCELSPLAKCSTVPDGRHDCRCHDRPDPGNLADAGTLGIACRDPF